MPVLIIIRLLKVVYLVKFGRINGTYWGHFIGEGMEAMFNQIHKRKNEFFLYYFVPVKTVNAHWEIILRRNLNISNFFGMHLFRLNQIIPGGKSHEIMLDIDPPSFFSTGKPANVIGKDLDFNEELTGEAWLHNHGWHSGEPIICLQIRDWATLFATHPSQSEQEIITGFAHTTYRDTDICTYKDAIQWLLDQGVWVIRLGKYASKKFPIVDNRFIDLPFCSDRNDLLDIWLIKHAAGIISTSSGGDLLAMRYSVPILYVNNVPLVKLACFTNSISAPKKHINIQNEKPLKLSQILESGYNKTDDYLKAGIRLVDLNKNEILEATKEFWWRISNIWVETDESIATQEKFRQFLKEWPPFLALKYSINPDIKLGNHWTQQQSSDFFDLM
jgi:putative glycosyltransferase (TIGR04372 family)